MLRAIKIAVVVWIAVVGPVSLLAWLSSGLWLPMLVADHFDRLAWSIGLLAFMLAGYVPWIIGERIAKHEAAKALRLAGRSVVQSGAVVRA